MSVDRDRGVAIVNEALDPLDGDTVFGQRWGSGAIIKLTPEELDAMNEGQIIALDVEGEYVVYLRWQTASARSVRRGLLATAGSTLRDAPFPAHQFPLQWFVAWLSPRSTHSAEDTPHIRLLHPRR